MVWTQRLWALQEGWTAFPQGRPLMLRLCWHVVTVKATAHTTPPTASRALRVRVPRFSFNLSICLSILQLCIRLPATRRNAHRLSPRWQQLPACSFSSVRKAKHHKHTQSAKNSCVWPRSMRECVYLEMAVLLRRTTTGERGQSQCAGVCLLLRCKWVQSWREHY